MHGTTSLTLLATQVWHPSLGMEKGEELDYDPTAYDMLHAVRVEWPCLSIDILRDNLGYHRSKV